MVWWKRTDEPELEAQPSADGTKPSHNYVPTFEPPTAVGWSLLGDQRRADSDVDSLIDMFDDGQTLAAAEVVVVEPTTEQSPPSFMTDSAPAEPDSIEQPATNGEYTAPTEEDGPSMADHQTSLEEAMQIDGALGVALVETATGMTLGTAGNPPMNLEVAAAGNSSVVQAKLRTMRDLGLDENLEDILITLQSQYHIIRTLGAEDGLFMYLVLDKERANLAMARFKLAKIEREIQI